MEDNIEENSDKLSGQALIEKNNKIKKEKQILEKIFKKIDKNKQKIVEKLIDNVAFMSITLDELKEDIKKYGIKEEYMNGKNQFGFKESVESKTYNTMLKNYMSAIKQLIDLLPVDEQKNAGEDLLKFIASGKKLII